MQNLDFILRLQDLLTPGMRAAATASDGTAQRIRTNLHGVEASANRATAGVNRMSGAMGGLLRMAAPLVGAFATFSFLSDSVKKFNTQAQAVAQLESTLKSTGGAAGFTSQQLQANASALQKTTLFGDEAIISMQSLLLTFTNIKGKVFADAQPAILDLATKMGGDLKGAAVQVGKALNDPIQGITALSRVGVSFSESQKATIKSLVETNRTAEAQAMILRELQTEFGGSAAAAAAAGTGPFTQLKNTLGDVQEELGAIIVKVGIKLLPVFTGMVNIFQGTVQAIKDMYHWFQRNRDVIELVGIAVGAMAVVWGGYSLAVGIATFATNAWAVAQGILNVIMNLNPIFLVISLIVALGGYIYWLVTRFDGWGKSMDGIWQVVKGFVKLTALGFKEMGESIWYWIQFAWLKTKSFVEYVGGAMQNVFNALKLASEFKFGDARKALTAELTSNTNKEIDALQKNYGASQAGNNAAKAAAIQQMVNGVGMVGLTRNTKTAAGTNPLKAVAGGSLPGAGAAGGSMGEEAKGSKAGGINSGGQRSIIINIGKQIEKLEVHVMDAKEGVTEIEGMVREALRRTLMSVNGIAS